MVERKGGPGVHLPRWGGGGLRQQEGFQLPPALATRHRLTSLHGQEGLPDLLPSLCP